MAGSIQATPEEIHATANQIGAIRNQVAESHQQALNQVQTLTSSGWVSESSGAFATLYQEFHALSNKLLSLMDSHQMQLHKTGDVYAENEAQLKGAFSSQQG